MKAIKRQAQALKLKEGLLCAKVVRLRLRRLSAASVQWESNLSASRPFRPAAGRPDRLGSVRRGSEPAVVVGKTMLWLDVALNWQMHSLRPTCFL